MALGGDFNHPLDDLTQVLPSVLMALLTRRLVDADKELAVARGLPCVCRFDGGANKRPTQIDGLLVSTRLAIALRDAQAIAETGIPGHTPAEFELDVEMVGQPVVRFVKPEPVTLLERDPDLLADLVDRLLAPLEESRDAALATGDVDRAWGFWTWAAEEVLLALSLPHLQPPDIDRRPPLPVALDSMRRGRGTAALVREDRLCPRQQRSNGAPETCPLARLHGVQGAIRPVLRWLRDPHRAPGVGFVLM